MQVSSFPQLLQPCGVHLNYLYVVTITVAYKIINRKLNQVGICGSCSYNLFPHIIYKYNVLLPAQFIIMVIYSIILHIFFY